MQYPTFEEAEVSYRLQVQIPDELAEAVKGAARADRRSMASWAAVVLEREARRVSVRAAMYANECVGCNAPVKGGALLCDDCAAQLEDVKDPSPVAPASNTERSSRVQGVPKGARREAALAPKVGTQGWADPCEHPRTVKRETTFGVRRFCADPECGALV